MRWSKAMVVLCGLALLLAFAAPVMASDTTKGTIKSVSANHKEFVMTDENGKDWTFRASDNLNVRVDDKASSLENLKEGDKVFITYAKEGNRLIASEVRTKGSQDTANALTTEGKIKSMDKTNNEFVLTDKNGKEWTFRLNDSTKVMTSNNRTTKMENMKTGQRVKVHYMKKGRDFWATEVREEPEDR